MISRLLLGNAREKNRALLAGEPLRSQRQGLGKRACVRFFHPGLGVIENHLSTFALDEIAPVGSAVLSLSADGVGASANRRVFAPVLEKKNSLFTKP